MQHHWSWKVAQTIIATVRLFPILHGIVNGCIIIQHVMLQRPTSKFLTGFVSSTLLFISKLFYSVLTIL